MRVTFEYKRQHYAVELFYVQAELPLGRQGHVNRTPNALLQDGGRRPQCIVGIKGDLDFALRAFLDAFGKHFARYAARMVLRSIVRKLHLYGLGLGK